MSTFLYAFKTQDRLIKEGARIRPIIIHAGAREALPDMLK